jgi:hypothetical protein
MSWTRYVNWLYLVHIGIKLYCFKIEDAFAPGYDPALELAKMHTMKKAPIDDSAKDPLFGEDIPWTENLRRKEQDVIDHIVHGEESGHYFMLLGPKVRMNHKGTSQA